MKRIFNTDLLKSAIIALLAVALVTGQQATSPAVTYGGIMNSGVSAIAPGGATTFYGNQLFGQLVSTGTAAYTGTTDTAANICAMLPVNGQAAPQYGWLWQVLNTSGSADTITLAGGTGVTLNSTSLTVPQNDFKLFWMQATNCSAGNQAIKGYAIGAAAAF